MNNTPQAACWSDVLDSRQGNLLVMRSGAVYRFLDDSATTSLWLSLARVNVCDQVIVNVNGEMAVVYEISNQDLNEMVRAAPQR